jgi:hypothetical protein
VVRRGISSRLIGLTFTADAWADFDRLASATGRTVTARRGGYAVELTGLRPLIEDPH